MFADRQLSPASRINYLEQKPHVFQSYPSVRYHPDGSTKTVNGEAEDRALESPWRDTPYPPIPLVAPVAEPTLGELKAENLRLQDAFATLTAEHARLAKDHADVQSYCAERVAEVLELRAAASKKAKSAPSPKPATE
jgi:hypothetical protein